MRLVNLAHGDLDDPRRLPSLVVVEATGLNPFAGADRRRARDDGPSATCSSGGCSTARSSAASLSPILVTFGLAIDPPERPADRSSRPTREASTPARIETRQHRRQRAARRSACFPLLTLDRRGPASSSALQLLHRPDRGWAARSGPPPTIRDAARLIGIDDRRSTASRWPSRWRPSRSPASSSGIRTTFGPSDGPIAPDLRVRGGDHRRPRARCGARWSAASSWASRRRRRPDQPGLPVLAGHLVFLAVLLFRPQRPVPAPEPAEDA